MATEVVHMSGPGATNLVQGPEGAAPPEVLNKFEILMTIFGEVGDPIDGK
jgi:hypothetical protein